MSTFTEHPPVPQALKEALKDHPELIAELADGLKMVGRAPGMSKAQRSDQFEAAIWALEGDLDDFFARAAAELKTAEAAGDVALIEQAKAKRQLMFSARSSFPDFLAELGAFFD